MARSKSDEMIVQGVRVDSINEYNVALALDRLNLDYAFQYYFGDMGIRGSQTIDFLVYTTPKPTPLFVHGEYWDAGVKAIEEVLKQSSINMKMRGTWARCAGLGRMSSSFGNTSARRKTRHSTA